MSYVPYSPASEKTKLSPRARELTTQIEKVVLDFQRSYPDTSPRDVQEALRAASGASDATPDSRRLLATSLAGGIAALVGVLFFVRESGGAADSDAGFMIWIVVGAAVLVALVALARRS